MARGRRFSGWSAGGATVWAAFESFRSAAHLLTGKGQIVEANSCFARMFGASREAYLGRRQEDLCAGELDARRRQARRMLAEAAARGTWEGTIENRGSDGRRFATRAHVFPALVDGRRYFVCIQEEPGGQLCGRAREGSAPGLRSLAAPG